MKAKNDKENNEFRDKVLEGLDLSYQRLIEYKRKNNGELVIMKDGKIVKVKPQIVCLTCTILFFLVNKLSDGIESASYQYGESSYVGLN